MATQMNSSEVGNDIIDLTTDDYSKVILPKELVNRGDSDIGNINKTEVDVEFLGSCGRFIPVITISDSDTECDKSHSHSTSQHSRVISNLNILNNKCALNETRSYILKAGSSTPVEDLSEKPKGHGKLKRKSCSSEKIKSEQMKILKTAGKALVFKKQSIAETTVTNDKQKHSSTDSKYNVQMKHIKNEILTEAECSQNKIFNRKIKNERDKDGSKAHVKKPKIKVKIIMKKPVSGINETQPRNTPVEESVKTEKTAIHNLFRFLSDSVARKDVDNGSSATINHGIQTPGTQNVVDKKYLDLNKNVCFNKRTDQVNKSVTESAPKSAIKKDINDINNAMENLSKVMQSDSLRRLEGNVDGEDNKGISEMSKETSNNNVNENRIVCSQLAIYGAKLPTNTTGNGRIESDYNEESQALPSASTAHEQRETPTSEVQLLPARMTITECGNQVVYSVPLLRLPVQRQIVYFSPDYIEIFMKKVRDVFNAEKFLQAIPDPFRYFRKEKNNENKYNDECLALMYLKSKYRKIPFPDIAYLFEKNKCNLTLTCDDLDVWTSSQRRKVRKFGLGCGCTKPHELSMTFVHEVTFIENKKVIEFHLQSKRRKKATTFEIAKLRGELRHCGHCGVSDLLTEDMGTCSVFHLFCKICIQNAVDTRLSRCENPFSCLYKECQWLFSMEVLKEMEMAGVKLLETCPYCGFADIPSEKDEVFCCLNLDCMRETCRQCKGPNHTPYPCVMTLRPQVEMPRVISNSSRYDEYKNHLQSTDTHQRNYTVQQQPQSLMQYPQQPLMHQQQSFMHQPQQSLIHHPQSPSTQHSWPPFMIQGPVMQYHHPPQWQC
ncbi:uncharacterized protein LOC111863319 isoform X2 [Cryptotermes secundus]|uniref:uncharacterized protein LOC111863319 isoform X2 n=1 Tax=Cryptotermes secundus TaxID=105785 RepID=UPI000CD7D11B|nr:uncharacterized protein LOC111863319 isoform X2 [Cryptotermes secundus]